MTITKRERKEKMLQVPIDEALHKKFKLKCMALDTTMAEQVERFIEEFLKRKTYGEKA